MGRDVDIEQAIKVQKSIQKRLKKKQELQRIIEKNIELQEQLKPKRRLSQKQKKILMQIEKAGIGATKGTLKILGFKTTKKRKK